MVIDLALGLTMAAQLLALAGVYASIKVKIEVLSTKVDYIEKAVDKIANRSADV